jgi:carbonic anhydrase
MKVVMANAYQLRCERAVAMGLRHEGWASMTVIQTLTDRNDAFARDHFDGDLTIIPSLLTMIVGCVDPRVDPFDVLGLAPGEAVIIRNVGGRVTPALVGELTMLDAVARSAGGHLGSGWNLIVLHHTDCGITRLVDFPQMLADYFDVDPSALDALAVADPYAAVAADVAALRSDPLVPAGFAITGLVYDIDTGHIEVVVE